MTDDRLTRQELSWLLAQEAGGAAEALRKDVSRLSNPPPPGAEAPPPLSTSLDALEDAIARLSLLHSGPSASQKRRGRIDLAALLCEVAPEARISMEPGPGTEVFGEEGELRRMLHLLLNQTNSAGTSQSAGSEVEIRRQDRWVKISVELGPDASPNGRHGAPMVESHGDSPRRPVRIGARLAGDVAACGWGQRPTRSSGTA